MFTPLSRSRFAPQSVCSSSLSAVYSRSNLSRCQIRYNHLITVVETPSAIEHGGTALPLPNASIDAQDRKGGGKCANPNVKATPTPKTTLSSIKKAINASEAALINNGEQTESESGRRSLKEEASLVAKHSKGSPDEETTPPGLKNVSEQVDYNPARANHEKKLHIATKKKRTTEDKETPMAGVGSNVLDIKGLSLLVAEIRRTTNRKRTGRRAMTEAKERKPRSQLSSASETDIPMTSSPETPRQPGEIDPQIESEKETSQKKPRLGTGLAKGKKSHKTSKATRRSLVRKMHYPTEASEEAERNLVRKTPFSSKASEEAELNLVRKTPYSTKASEEAELNLVRKTHSPAKASEEAELNLVRKTPSSTKAEPSLIRKTLSYAKVSVVTQPSLIRKTLPLAKIESAESLNEHIIAALQRQRHSRMEKALLMKQLRRSLLSRPAKATASPKVRLAATKSTERPPKANTSKTTKKPGYKFPRGPLKEARGMTAHEVKTIDAIDLELVPIEIPQPPVPNLAYGLERVLFNPGVYHLRDPRSRVFNFDPYLESIMPVADFDFNALKEYITSSRDDALLSAATTQNKKYTGSTSSMTSALAHFHFLLSQWRPVNISNLSQGFPETLKSFTQLQRAPSAIFLRWRNGTYAIDADKEFDSANILMMLGKSMEKLLTLPTQDFEKYRKENSDQISKDQRNEAESYHYTTMGDFLMRSQLDAYDPRIPGTGMFDLKTRAVVSIRMDAQNYHQGLGYEIRNRHGEFESYEREYYDMIRAAFLKYSLQVRMGRMDGIFVAFHNTERIFGFQYISLPEMDLALHGNEDLTIGDSEFKLSLGLLNQVLDRATAKFPEQSLRIFFEARETSAPFMYIFAEPVTEDDIIRIQESKKAEIEAYERTVLGIHREQTPEEIKHDEEEAEWEELQAKVEDSIDNDELEIIDESERPDEDSDHEGVVDSNSHDESSIDEASIDSAARLSDEHFSMPSSEAGLANNGDAELLGIDVKQVQHDEASDVIDNEELEDISRSSADDEDDRIAWSDLDIREHHGTEETYMDAPALHTEAVDIPEDSNEALTELKMDENLATEAANIGNADNGSNHSSKSTTGEENLLAMTLTIRNKVNGKYVIRPQNLSSDDLWTVEYALAEVKTPQQSRTLYEKTQKRRALALKQDKKEAKSKFQMTYTRRLMQLSSKGRKWRKEQNDIDREQPIKVLGDQMEGAS